MRLGIFAKTFAGNDPEAVLRQSAEAGFEGVQYNMACSGLAAMPDAIPSDVAQAVAAAATATAQPVFAVSGTYNMIHPDVAVRREGERRLKVIAAACAALGTKVVSGTQTGVRDGGCKVTICRDSIALRLGEFYFFGANSFARNLYVVRASGSNREYGFAIFA